MNEENELRKIIRQMMVEEFNLKIKEHEDKMKKLRSFISQVINEDLITPQEDSDLKNKSEDDEDSNEEITS